MKLSINDGNLEKVPEKEAPKCVDYLSLSLNLERFNNNDDEDDDIEDRQKEIQGLLSSAFDDLSSLSDGEDEDVDCDAYDGNDISYKNIITLSNDCLNRLSGLTSTPRLANNSSLGKQIDNTLQKSSNGYRMESDLNEDTNNISNTLNDLIIGNESKNSSLEQIRCDPHFRRASKLFDSNSFKQSQIQLLLDENRRLSNEVIVLQQKVSSLNGNYEGLQYKFKEFDKLNNEKEQELVRLEGNIKSLELQIGIEREAKLEVQRKLATSEATIESLEFQLKEISKSDFMVRAKETQHLVVAQLQHKHENQLDLLREESDGLRSQLNSKKDQIKSLKQQIERMKLESSHENSISDQLKDMVRVAKDMWEKEMKDKVSTDFKAILQTTQLEWAKNSEKELINAKTGWDADLKNEVFKIISLLKNKAKLSSGNEAIDINLKFVPLLNLWHAIECAYNDKELKLLSKTEELREAKENLEKALVESKLDTSINHKTSASSDALYLELKSELERVYEEADQMKHKVHKYKQHYHQLVKKHNNEIDCIKKEFAAILECAKKNLS